MSQSDPSEKAALPTGFLASCYFVAISCLGGLIVSNYVETQPGSAVALSDHVLWWMVGAGLIAGALAASNMESESLPGPISLVGSMVLLEIGIVCGLLSAPILFRSSIMTMDGEIHPGRLYLLLHVLPSSETIAASSAYVGVSYAIFMVVPMVRHQFPTLKGLVPALASGGLITLCFLTWQAYSLKGDRPIAGAIASQIRTPDREDRIKSTERDCDAGNPRACSDYISAEWSQSREEGELRAYTKLCKLNPQMDFPPCVELATILARKTSQENAIDQVCAMNLGGCKTVAQAFEARYTMGYAQRAYHTVCEQLPSDDSCHRAKDLEAYVEPELMAPLQPTEAGPFCEFDVKSCRALAEQAMKNGHFDHAAWLAFTSCRAGKIELDNCSTWLQVARRRTYFVEILDHLLEARALDAPVDDAKTIASVVEQRCARKDGLSCFFHAVLSEIDHPNDIEGPRTIYQQACGLGYVRGCTNALSISKRHPGNGMPLPSDAEQQFSVLCFERNEPEACGQLALLAVDVFEWKLMHREQVDRAAMRMLLEGACQREVAARLGDKDACRTYTRLKRGTTLTG